MERQTRKYLLMLALVLYDRLDPWDRYGIRKTDLYKASKIDLIRFINAVYGNWIELLGIDEYKRLKWSCEYAAINKLWSA